MGGDGTAALFEAEPGAATRALPAPYRRREPEKTLLHRLVREHLATLLAEMNEHGRGLPRHVERELRSYLSCGLLSEGFLRVCCPACGEELLVAFSCKTRGFCPSCCARRMYETAAHLFDRVLPFVAWRQWVLSYPRWLRLLLARFPRAAQGSAAIFLSEVFRWQRLQARRLGLAGPKTGAVCFTQRFGSRLNLNLHHHALVPDGVFLAPEDGAVHFEKLARPRPAELERILARIVRRTLALVERLGLREAEPDDALSNLQVEAVQAHFGFAQQKAPPKLSAFLEGFSLEAGRLGPRGPWVRAEATPLAKARAPPGQLGFEKPVDDPGIDPAWPHRFEPKPDTSRPAPVFRRIAPIRAPSPGRSERDVPRRSRRRQTRIHGQRNSSTARVPLAPGGSPASHVHQRNRSCKEIERMTKNASGSENPLAQFLAVPGAKTTLPVSSARSPFSLEFAKEARQAFGQFHYQLGGDHALYYNLHLAEVLHTAISKPNAQYRPLERALVADLGDAVSFTAKEGQLTLNQYAVHPNHRVQAIVMVHRGRIVFETYPGMNPMDQHVWMSPGKSTVALVIAQMESEGKIDMNREVVDYLPDFKGTNWDGIRMIDAANMAAALQLEETLEAIVDPGSIIVRFFSAEFGDPNPATGQVDDWLAILKTADRIDGEAPGYRFRYSSAVTQVFVKIAESIENKTWAELFEDRVWGHMTARTSMQHHLTPDGTSVAHGLLSTTAEDFARFGMLFTPSWDKAAVKPVVSPQLLKRLQTAGSPEAFQRGAKYKGLVEDFGEAPLMNSYQFDAVFEDGALWKHGNLGQGIYIDPSRDFSGVYFSTNGYIAPYGEDRMPGYLRRAAKLVAGG